MIMSSDFASVVSRRGGRWCVPGMSRGRVVAQGVLTETHDLLIGYAPGRRWTKRDVLMTIEYMLGRFAERTPTSSSATTTIPRVRIDDAASSPCELEVIGQLRDALYLGN